MQNFTEVDGIDPSGSVCQTKNGMKVIDLSILGLFFNELLLKTFQRTFFIIRTLQKYLFRIKLVIHVVEKKRMYILLSYTFRENTINTTPLFHTSALKISYVNKSFLLIQSTKVSKEGPKVFGDQNQTKMCQEGGSKCDRGGFKM